MPSGGLRFSLPRRVGLSNELGCRIIRASAGSIGVAYDRYECKLASVLHAASSIFARPARAAAYVLLSHRCGTTALRFYPTLLLVLLGALDKAAAKLGLRRVPEQTLCGLAVASGTAGALTGALALVLLQHKTRKQSFQLKYLIATGLALAIDNIL